jgi:hypothetical protein
VLREQPRYRLADATSCADDERRLSFE